MTKEADLRPSTWNEENSQTFIDLGRYAVPEREWQIAAFCDLIAPPDGPFTIIELCCGEGLLAEALLERYSNATLHGYDGSPAMLNQTTEQLARLGGLLCGVLFDIDGA